MNAIKPRVPDGSKVYSFLYRTTDPEYLTQDVLAISLPSGFYIDVGWFPEHDLKGEYVIRVFFRQWENEQIAPIRVRTVDDLVPAVELLAERFNAAVVSTSNSTSSPRLEPACFLCGVM